MQIFLNYYPNLRKCKYLKLIPVLGLTFVFSAAFLLLHCRGANAIQKHQIYQEEESIQPSSHESEPDSYSTRPHKPMLEYYPEKYRQKMGSGVSSHVEYKVKEEVPTAHEGKVSSHMQPTEHELQPTVREHKTAPPEHAVAPATIPHKAGTRLEEEKAPPAEKGKHEVGLEEVKEHAAEEHEVTISPIPGVTFVETFIKVLDHELNGRFLGWRPNDLIIGRFTDNINNFQLGLLEAARFTALRLKENLSRLGEADAYDQDLQMAVNLLMNKSTQFWFPSAESSYNEALKHFRKYLERLKTGKAHFYYRVDTLIALVSSYRDFLGNCTNNLVKNREKDGSPVSWFKSDDYFYYSQGAAYLIYEILKVVQVGFHEQLVTIDAVDVMEEAIHELHRGVSMSPWIILDRPLDSIFANHRANLGAVLGEATHLLTVMTQF